MNEEEFGRLKAGWKQEILDPVERLNGWLDAIDRRVDAFCKRSPIRSPGEVLGLLENLVGVHPG